MLFAPIIRHPARVLLIALLAAVALASSAMGQTAFIPESRSEAGASLPDQLTPEMVDSLMSRLTDAEIRTILREELVRRAEEQATADADSTDTLAEIEARLAEMSATIQERTARWAVAIRNLPDRTPNIEAQLAKAEHGVPAMLLAALAGLLAGIAAAVLTARATRTWRGWLTLPNSPGYWEKVGRTAVLGITDLLPVVAFLAATRLTAGVLGGRGEGLGTLGPLTDYQWIYQTGVTYSWVFIVIIRRAFAPDAPAIRIAPLDDDLAWRLHRLLRLAVRIGAGGWLVGGLFFHFGLGFPPIMVLRACAGTLVALVLLGGLWHNRAQIRAATALVVSGSGSALGRMVEAGAPVALALYIVIAWLYWLAHWLETGNDRLAGPAGTLIVYLVLPILDRMGREVIASAIRSRTPLAERFRGVFQGAWRLILGLGAVFEVCLLWGLDLYDLALGARAPAWASTACDILVTVLLGYLIWKLIGAALYTERRISDAAEDVDPSSVPSATRLETLVPLCRNTLLGVLAITIAMIVLSDLGVDIAPLIASAGIIGIAVGFGAQSLVKDVFAGIFFLIDDAFRVGEYIEIDAETRGEVENISVRSMQLRHHRGAVITIPFGELKQIMNHNRDWVIYKMSFRMEPDTDPQKFKTLVKEVGKEFLVHPEHGSKFLEPLKSQGVYYVDDDSALVMRVKFKCKPRAQFVLRREIYHRLRAVFAENDLKLARRKVEVVGTGDSDGLAGQAASAAEEQRLAGPPPGPA